MSFFCALSFSLLASNVKPNQNHMETERISEILQFWLGGNQRNNYRDKWFPSSLNANSREESQQQKIDAVIYRHFKIDLLKAVNGEYSSWIATQRNDVRANSDTKDSITDFLNAAVALIILLDQFSRHIYRFENLPVDSFERENADQLAFAASQKIHESNDERIKNAVFDLPLATFIFSIMPYRHNPTVLNLSFVIEALRSKERVDAEKSDFDRELLLKFQKQTIRRLQHLQDREMLEATDEILEHFPFDVNVGESEYLSHPLVKATDSFLRRQFAAQRADDSAPVSSVLFVSLSGGVDSMVLFKILAILRDAYSRSKRPAIHIQDILAIHIDYANRPESGREAAFVQQWTAQLGYCCKVRVVDEVTRGVTARDEYEKISRNIRYQFYKNCVEETAKSFGSGIGYEKEESGLANRCNWIDSGVMFGHHQGDVQENVISNVMRGCSPFYLSGMTESSVANGVLVWRPLLDHKKEEIFAFAHKYGIPYFKDSTPSWSTRGKLRRQLLPLLLDMYGQGCLHNLTALARDSDESRDLINRTVFQPFYNSVRRCSCGLSVNILSYLSQPSSFWRETLKELMHSMSMAMVRDKAVENFVARLHSLQSELLQGKSIGGWLELRKGYHTFLSSAGELVIVRDNVLRRSLQVMNPATTKNQLQQRRSGQAKSRKSGRSKPQEIEQRASLPIEENSDELLNVAGLMVEGSDLKSAGTIETVSAAAAVEHIPDSETPETGDDSRVMLNIRRVSEGPSETDWVTELSYNSAALQSFSTIHFAPFAPSSGEINASTIVIGPWIVIVSVAISSSSSSAAINSFPLTNPEDLLPGSFQYSLEIPCCEDSEQLELRILWTLIDSGEIDGEKYTPVKKRFRPLDQRLREGLPIYILQSGPEIEEPPAGSSGREARTLEATFCYHHYRVPHP